MVRTKWIEPEITTIRNDWREKILNVLPKGFFAIRVSNSSNSRVVNTLAPHKVL